MSWNRRDVLGGLGLASAHALWFAFGCGGAARPVARAPAAASDEIRGWLRDAVALIHGAGFTGHALAVTREHVVAAQDVFGTGMRRGYHDGVVLTARDAHGRREQVTSVLSRDGVLAAARVLAGNAAPARLDFGPVPPATRAPASPSDANLVDSVAAITHRESHGSSRIVYASNSLELDDALVWSISAVPARDLEQRLSRVRRTVTQVAWNGAQPVISEASRAWSGGVHDQTFSDDDLAHARDVALELMTPGAFTDGEYTLALAPEIVAGLIDAAALGLYTPHAQRRPEVARRLAPGAVIASPAVSLVDDPTAVGAYGGFRFDDAGELAAPAAVIDRGRLVGTCARGRRPGHVGALALEPSHLRIAPGTWADEAAFETGYLLEGNRGVLVDPASDRVVIAVQRALEIQHGQRTGRAYADIEVVGELAALLGSVAEATRTTRTIGVRDERDGLPRWRSLEAPWLRAKGTIRARRRFG